MKKWIFYLVCFCLSLSALAQTDTSIPPYKRFPTLPPIQILLADSVTKYTKDKLPENTPILFMLFSPECSHCQHETEELVAHKDELKNIQIVMVTLHPLYMMKDFVEHYKLNELPNVVVGKDYQYFFPSFYNIRNLPYLAMYDRKGKLITTFEGSMPIEKVIETFKNN
jgi:thioredoxin-related protein